MDRRLEVRGCKLLRDVVLISLQIGKEEGDLKCSLFDDLAKNKINIVYISSINEGKETLSIAIEKDDYERVSTYFDEKFRDIFKAAYPASIFSLFPYRNDPSIMDLFLDLLRERVFNIISLCNSNSAISIVLHESHTDRFTSFIKETFDLQGDQWPMDWKKVQTGNEGLYREVVASYQEKRPKVYGLELFKDILLLKGILKKDSIGTLSSYLRGISEKGKEIIFVSQNWTEDTDSISLSFCYRDKYEALTSTPLSRNYGFVFSMNGPHFGERYGICRGMLRGFKKENIELFSLNCTVASIRGVIHPDHTEKAISILKEHFEIPTIVER